MPWIYKPPSASFLLTRRARRAEWSSTETARRSRGRPGPSLGHRTTWRASPPCSAPQGPVWSMWPRTWRMQCWVPRAFRSQWGHAPVTSREHGVRPQEQCPGLWTKHPPQCPREQQVTGGSQPGDWNQGAPLRAQTQKFFSLLRDGLRV